MTVPNFPQTTGGYFCSVCNQWIAHGTQHICGGSPPASNLPRPQYAPLQGWQCPVCGTVCAPWVNVCPGVHVARTNLTDTLIADGLRLRAMLRRAYDLIRSAGHGSWMDETNEWRASAHAWICDLEAIMAGEPVFSAAPTHLLCDRCGLAVEYVGSGLGASCPRCAVGALRPPARGVDPSSLPSSDAAPTWDANCGQCGWPHHPDDGPACKNCGGSLFGAAPRDERARERELLALVDEMLFHITTSPNGITTEYLPQIGAPVYWPKIGREHVERWRAARAAVGGAKP